VSSEHLGPPIEVEQEDHDQANRGAEEGEDQPVRQSRDQLGIAFLSERANARRQLAAFERAGDAVETPGDLSEHRQHLEDVVQHVLSQLLRARQAELSFVCVLSRFLDDAEGRIDQPQGPFQRCQSPEDTGQLGVERQPEADNHGEQVVENVGARLHARA
jgi:hypothetical protein